MDRASTPEDCLLRRLPKANDPRLWLFAALGRREFRRFQRRFGGRKIWIPKPPCLLPCRFCPSRDEHIRLLRARGMCARRIARRFGVTHKRVYAVLRSGR